MSNITGVIRNINTTSTDPSVGVNGSIIPGSTTQVGGSNPSGNLAPINLDSQGRVIVNAGQIFGVQVLQVLYQEISATPIGTEETINTYTAPVGKIAYLLSILGSGENRAQFNVYLDSGLLDRRYTNVTQLSADFDYKTGTSSVPGFVIPVGSVISMSVINSGTTTSNYNSRFLILEVT